MKQELINRWDTFLNKIEARFSETLQQAEQASFEFLEESNYDYGQTMQAFVGMKGQIRSLIQKIDDTWDGKVKNQMQNALASSDWIDQSQKGSKLSQELWKKLEYFETILEGKLSQKYYDNIIKIADKDFLCSQCNAKLQIDKRIFRSQYLSCDYCNTVNTFEPETKYTQLGGTVDNIIKLKLFEEKKALSHAYQKIKEKEHFGKATNKDWEHYKAQYLTYYECFFTERIKLNSDYEKRFEQDMERKVKEFEKFKQR
ncbi:hypothetical protein [Tenacibaculum sp. SDUM215027]|uniref:hypothetical protein n=1 Tax=Tenacibaculum sp. SDUM215027 TaxID=3422596 RepID=UPI003D314B61